MWKVLFVGHTLWIRKDADAFVQTNTWYRVVSKNQDKENSAQNIAGQSFTFDHSALLVNVYDANRSDYL